MLNQYSEVLVSGGAGFIGSHVVDRLLQEGVGVRVLDDLSSGDFNNIENHCSDQKFKFIQGSILNPEDVKEAIKGVDAVLHLAGLVSVTKSVENPLLSNDVNLKGTLNLLKMSRDFEVDRFIFSSSSAVYGDTTSLPIKEETVPDPLSPYAVDKLAAEYYSKIFYELYGLKTTVLRYFNVYGPRQKDGPYCGVISKFINFLLENKAVTIFGDGEQKRDFVNIKDVVEANMLALTKEKANGKIYNVGTGAAITINKLVEKIQKILDIKIEPIYVEARKGDVIESFSDISKIKKDLGYLPKVNINQGLDETIKYFSNYRKSP